MANRGFFLSTPVPAPGWSDTGEWGRAYEDQMTARRRRSVIPAEVAKDSGGASGPAEQVPKRERDDAAEDASQGFFQDFIAPKWMRELGVVAQHPMAAWSIGSMWKGSLNTTTIATRFAASIGLQESKRNEGSQVNAFRHAIWQAMITRDFGELFARTVGDAHEENPKALGAISTPAHRAFPSLEEADQAADLLNNVIGRSIAANAAGATNAELARRTLNHFRQQGLWVALPQKDGSFRVSQQVLASDQYAKSHKELSGRNDYGYTAEEWRAVEERQKLIERERRKLTRGPKW